MIKGDSMRFLFKAAESTCFCLIGDIPCMSKDFTVETFVHISQTSKSLSSPKPTITEQFTRDALVVLAGSKEKGRDFVYFTEVKCIPSTDLATIERLWNKFSGGKFGYSVQKVSPISTHIMLRICAQ